MAETREQIIEQVARVIHNEFEACRGRNGVDSRKLASAALPVAVKAVTDRVRALHKLTPLATPIEDAGTCTCCGRNYPCPTVRLLHQIDAELGADS